MIARTKSFIYNRELTNSEGTATGNLIWNVADGTKLRIAVGRLSGSDTSLITADGCSLTVLGL